MGATTFSCVKKGVNAREAFKDAREEALYDYGHRGYTGSIAEKNDFVMITPPPGVDPVVYADQLLDDDDHRIGDKWGPAGCIKLQEDKFLFFGWASC